MKDFIAKIKAFFKKHKMNEKQQKIYNIVTTTIQIALVLVTVTISLIVAINPNINNGEVSALPVKLLPVLSNSMDGGKEDSFKQGDLVIATTPKDTSALEVGDIVTFQYQIGDAIVLNTHRIIQKDSDIYGVYYIVQGDNPQATKTDMLRADDVLAVYKGKIAGLGKAIAWLQEPTHFLLVIILPLIALFIYNAILVVRMIMEVKAAKLKAEMEANGGAAAAEIDAEEIKRQAIAEYLAQQQAAKGGEAPVEDADAPTTDTTVEDDQIFFQEENPSQDDNKPE